MVLCPTKTEEPSIGGGFVSAWQAIEPKQRSHDDCWLISQPDHAALAGDVARHFAPALDDEIVRAIAVHDEGWRSFDEKELTAEHPRSFLDMAPKEFVRAWTLSIKRAEAGSAAGGIIVSRHFCRLCRDRLNSATDSGEDLGILRGFLEQEKLRDENLSARQRRSQADLEALTDVLQFCDLVSLYLCCGSAENVQFPQKLAHGPVRLRREQEACIFEPTPFAQSFDLAVSARRRSDGREAGTTFSFLVW